MNYKISLFSVFCTLYSVFGILYFSPLSAQDIDRTVTVERDFQPVIGEAGKLATTPSIVETKIEPAETEYQLSTINYQLSTTEISPLLSQPNKFTPARKYNGYIGGAVGHPNTLLKFGYTHADKRNNSLSLYAHHHAEWGLATLSRTKIGMDYSHRFASCELYFGVNGGNLYYHKYGHFYDYSSAHGMWEPNKKAYHHPSALTDRDKTNLWSAEAFVGVKSNAKEAIQYRVQTGYVLFAKPNAVAEHQIRTRGSFDWHSDVHHVGMNASLQNNFIGLTGNLASAINPILYGPRHNIRLEPYYGYAGSRVNLHVGVNLDVNIGRGRNALSATDDVAFAPSPNIRLDAQLVPRWLALYADVSGKLATGTVQAYMEGNRYRIIHPGIISHHLALHTPVDAEVGFHIKPHRDLLIEVRGGYALYLNTTTLIAVTDSAIYQRGKLDIPMQAGDLSYTYCDLGRGKIGASFNYHYRDIVRINLYGDYYFWSALRYESNGYYYNDAEAQAVKDVRNNISRTVYDRANWQIGLRIDGRIDQHWSLYSDNSFEGSRLALATDGEHILRPTIDLNLGVQYEMYVGKKSKTRQASSSHNLILFGQLNNWLHRKNEIYYGYRSQGINFLVGATYKF